ncbi:MAG: aminotransferase class V-fold PLP-dependent enzyme, partial [Deltaproteobacteria bacterium]|nr:aminotransferase class V-fold PLP-dependent enzyme [Deltaproteobacteria bacterium]
MATNRIFNFNAGPSALPQPVLEKIQASLLDYEGCGMSVMEISHRSKWFDDIINDALDRVKRLLGISDDFEVLF